MYIPVAFAQLAKNVGAYVEKWCQEERTVSSLAVHAPQHPTSDPTTRTVTVEVYITSADRRLTIVSSRWFLK